MSGLPGQTIERNPEQSEYDRDDKKAAPKGVRSGAEGGGAPK
jgi:hypothetical protein